MKNVTFTLFIVFLVLKLAGTVDWSWWWVTAPLWLDVLVFIVIYFTTSMLGC